MNLLKKTFSEFIEKKCTTLAAALAYYTAFALPPMLYLLVSVLTLGLSVAYEGETAENQAQDLLTNQASQLLGNPTIADEVTKILEKNDQSSGKWWKTLISFVGILIGSTGVVAALQAALNQVWEVTPDPETTGWMEILKKRVLSLGMILGLGFLLLVSLVISSVLSVAGEQIGEAIGMSETIAAAVNFVVQALVVFVIFAAIFKFMPDAKVGWKDVAVGAGVTMVLFLLGRFALQAYFSFSEPGAQFGSAAASLAVLLVWVYYTAMIVLLGAEATQIYAVRYGNGIQPEKHAVRIVQEIKRTEKTG